MTIAPARNPLRRAIRRALIAGPVAAVASQVPGAFAQQEGAEGIAIEEVVVTGSRLVRQDFTAISPIATVDQDVIRQSGNVTLEETLNMYP